MKNTNSFRIAIVFVGAIVLIMLFYKCQYERREPERKNYLTTEKVNNLFVEWYEPDQTRSSKDCWVTDSTRTWIYIGYTYDDERYAFRTTDKYFIAKKMRYKEKNYTSQDPFECFDSILIPLDSFSIK